MRLSLYVLVVAVLCVGLLSPTHGVSVPLFSKVVKEGKQTQAEKPAAAATETQPSSVTTATTTIATTAATETTPTTTNPTALASGQPESLAVSATTGNEAKRFAYVTFVISSNDYIKGCVLLGKSLALSGSKLPRVLLTLTDLPPAQMDALKQIGGWEVRRVQHIATPFPDKCWRFCDMYGKLRVWEAMTDYDLAMYLDGDMYVSKNIDYMFQTHAELPVSEIAAVADSGAPHINGGMFLFRPSQAVFRDMISKLGKIEHAVIRHPFSLRYAYEYTEQSFIHAYFRPCLLNENCDSKRLRILSSKYNCQLHTPACRAEFETNPSEVAVFHFTSLPKPWTCGEGASCCDSIKGKWSTNVHSKSEMCASKTFVRAHDIWARTWRAECGPGMKSSGLMTALEASLKPEALKKFEASKKASASTNTNTNSKDIKDNKDTKDNTNNNVVPNPPQVTDPTLQQPTQAQPKPQEPPQKETTSAVKSETKSVPPSEKK